MAQTTTLRAYLSELEDLLAAGASTKVITHCRHILRHFPQNVNAYRLLARALYDRGQRDGTDAHFDEAMEVFRRVLSVFPNDGIAHKYVALLFQRKEQVDRAIWHFERAHEQSPGDRDLQHHIHQLRTQRAGSPPSLKNNLTRGALARQHITARLFDQALIELRAAIDESPERIDLQVLLAETLWETQHPIEAGELAVQILNRQPYCLPANRILAHLWLENERPSDAQVFLDRIEALDPYAARHVLNADTSAPDTIMLDRLDYDVQSQAALSSETPTWLSDLDTVGSERLVNVGPFAGMDADWLGGAAADDSLSSVPSTPEEAASEDTFADWLSEMSRGADASDQPAVDAVLFAQESASEADDLPAFPDDLDALAQMPDQIESLLSPDQPPSSATGEEFSASDAFDDWLADVGKEVGVAAGDTPDLSSDWFVDDVGAADAITDDIPDSTDDVHRAADDNLDASTLADIGTEMPDWLSSALDTGSAHPEDARAEDAAWLPGKSEPIAEQPDDVDTGMLPAGWLDGTDDSSDELLDADEMALTDAFADLLADEPEPQTSFTTEPSDASKSPAPDWLDDKMYSDVPAQSDTSVPVRDQELDEPVLWSADEDDLSTSESPKQGVSDASAIFGAVALEGEWRSDDVQLWSELLDEPADADEYQQETADIDGLETDFAEDALMVAESAGDSDMREPDDNLVQPDMDSLLSATDDELLSALAAAESEDEHLVTGVGDSDIEAELAEVPDWLADVAPLTDDDLVDSVEDMTLSAIGDVMQHSGTESDDAEDGLGWLRTTDADEDWLSTLSAADTADVLDMVDMSADDLPGAAADQPEDEPSETAMSADFVSRPDFGSDDFDLLPATDALGADDDGPDDRQEQESLPKDDYVMADVDEHRDRGFEDVSQGLEIYSIDSAEDIEDDENVAAAEDDNLAWVRGQAIDAADSVEGIDETEEAIVQSYDPFEEGSPENVPHYESAQNTGILQPGELPAWMTAFTGEEMAAELDDDADFDIVKPDAEEDAEVEYAIQDAAEPVASADDETDDRGHARHTDDEDIDNESPEDLIADVIAADPADGIPAWLLAITESEADKLDSSLFEDVSPDNDVADGARDLVTSAEADWLYDISDAGQETSGDSVRRDTESALDLETVLFADDAVSDSAGEDEVGVRDVEQGAAWNIDSDMSGEVSNELRAELDAVADVVLFGSDDGDESADDDEVSARVVDQDASWDFDSDVSDATNDELSAELHAAADVVLFGSDDGDELAFDPETERSFELPYDDAEQTSLPRDTFAEQALLELGRDAYSDADADMQRDEPFAEPADMSHTTIHDQQIDETALTDTFEDDDFHLDDVVPVWLRRPKEGDLLEDAFDAMQDDIPEPEPPEWLRGVAEDDEQTGDSGA